MNGEEYVIDGKVFSAEHAIAYLAIKLSNQSNVLRDKLNETVMERSNLIAGIAECNESFVAMRAERDALQAKLDAVPVWAIALLRHESTDEAWEAWAREEGGESSEALSVVDAWLKRVQP